MDILHPSLPTPLQELSHKILDEAGVKLYIKRDDLIHPVVSGNKWRKLKYNLSAAKSSGQDVVVTFGGPYSNHLYATAAATNAIGMRSIGIVRGEEKETPTIDFCRNHGMDIRFVSRDEYRQRNSISYLFNLIKILGNAFIIPEGGTSGHGLKGVAEMVHETSKQLSQHVDYYAVAAGTGGTAAGILSAKADVLAFSALKGGDFLKADIDELLEQYKDRGNLTLLTDYHFGGYAKWNDDLLDFLIWFKTEFDIQTEQVYTAKMLYGLFDLIQKKHFKPGTTIVAVHTGGLQGLIKT
ncbi:1-aminocyclopropane-1-carboxylate deaminase/D-cysteine desulfhydrase [Dyadobacter sp. CY323]|uniref:1-aminocyclopropane-1-carboxylate deaminase/D-cysteine desulfhydrase n=1 Tax=Dyadobacter sp. CY323 TaxID=2907302 RepID=UPI001F492428|nr:pyridoxal-phosphate dependent enzyme [Dyadobacter sp. CY323]MCE6989351.1 pyridoxal-phosphate dependent enzyme [Dyadobacter sp. CY323]